MSGTGRIGWGVLLAHHGPDRLDCCARLQIGALRAHVCARCLGLWLSLCAAASLRLLGILPSDPATGRVIGLLVPAAGAGLWVAEQAGLRVRNPMRVLSGALIGLGVGWVLVAHLASPWSRELLELASAMGLALLLGLAARIARGGTNHQENCREAGFRGTPGSRDSGAGT